MALKKKVTVEQQGDNTIQGSHGRRVFTQMVKGVEEMLRLVYSNHLLFVGRRSTEKYQSLRRLALGNEDSGVEWVCLTRGIRMLRCLRVACGSLCLKETVADFLFFEFVIVLYHLLLVMQWGSRLT